MAIGTLYEVGYADKESAARLDGLMSQGNILLIDIRLVTRSRWYSAFNRKALEQRYDPDYVSETRLGNLNYRPEDRHKGIQLADGHEAAIDEIAEILAKGTSVVLLCACKNAETCHRSVVARLVQVRLTEPKPAQNQNTLASLGDSSLADLGLTRQIAERWDEIIALQQRDEEEERRFLDLMSQG